MADTRPAGRREGVIAAAVVGALLVAACGHAPVATQAREDQPRRECVVLTGSRIPQCVDAVSSLPATVAPIVIESHERLLGTGRDGDIGAALQQLDPSVFVQHR